MPDPVSNDDYTRTLAAVLHRPARLPVPAAAPRLLLGPQAAQELALASQRVQPARLLERGHRHRRPRLDDCLRHQLGRRRA